MAKKEETYNEAIEKLRKIVAEIENGDLDVDILSEKVKEATRLIKLCKEIDCKVPHAIVKGGDTRFFSVKNGLDWLLAERRRKGEEDSGLSLVAVHDGVRPFVSPEVVEACFDKAAVTGAVIPVVPMIDSLRETDEKGSHPVDRSRYMAVQTPQVFHLELLTKAYEQPYSSLFTDDASVVEAMGHAIDTVPGDRENIKITTPFDLLIAEAMFAR